MCAGVTRQAAGQLLREIERCGYIVRKGLIGGNRCFQQIEVELNFDSSRQLTEKTITGGTFVE
jgi:hypothetical protein